MRDPAFSFESLALTICVRLMSHNAMRCLKPTPFPERMRLAIPLTNTSGCTTSCCSRCLEHDAPKTIPSQLQTQPKDKKQACGCKLRSSLTSSLAYPFDALARSVVDPGCNDPVLWLASNPLTQRDEQAPQLVRQPIILTRTVWKLCYAPSDPCHPVMRNEDGEDQAFTCPWHGIAQKSNCKQQHAETTTSSKVMTF